jgi:hypothetical protein
MRVQIIKRRRGPIALDNSGTYAGRQSSNAAPVGVCLAPEERHVFDVAAFGDPFDHGQALLCDFRSDRRKGGVRDDVGA